MNSLGVTFYILMLCNIPSSLRRKKSNGAPGYELPHMLRVYTSDIDPSSGQFPVVQFDWAMLSPLPTKFSRGPGMTPARAISIHNIVVD